MTEYDYSPEAAENHRSKMVGIDNWRGGISQIRQSDPFTPATPVSPSHKLPSSKRRARSSDPPMDDDRGKSKTRDRTRSTTRHDRAPSMAPPPPPLPLLDRSRSVGPRSRTAPPRGDVYGVQQPGPGATPFYPVPVQQQMPYYPHAPGYSMPAPPYPYPQQQPTQNHHTRSRSSSQAYPLSGPGPMPAPPPQPTRTRSYSVQLPPPLPQQVHANSYPYAPPRYGGAPPPGYQQQPQPQQPQPMYMYAAQPPRAQTPGPMSTRGRDVPLLKRVFGFGMGKSREGSGRSKSRDGPRRGDSY
ncbi:hypothetical protein DFH08DRAFT_953525 [Mycena albidolilacea]|uniref:Uncharacterized protein n=1 Tax=Mycena albidolilacea TaxID=1033008 RepID=A0AAD7AGV8_9AGAR|nr:hypothetical protein DFH08DRAFT_953525 [Mycena albidolilacea]